MEIFALGHNHDSASLDVRETFSFEGDRLGPALDALRSCGSVVETVILSTCNRNEIYTVVSDPRIATTELQNFFHDFHSVTRGLVSHSFYSLKQEQAVEHLFTVAAGLDSMVIGETQIVAQVKKAFTEAHRRASTGPLLNRLFVNAFECAKKVRRRTRVSSGDVSISACAVDLAQKIFNDLSGKTAVLVGAGETIETTAAHLRDRGISRFVVANRTVERAAELADRLGGTGTSLDQIESLLETADVVVTSTASQERLLDRAMLQRVMQKRRGAPLFIIDLGVPRDVEPAARGMGNLFLYDIDDLTALAERTGRERAGEMAKAMEIVQEDVDSYMRWYRSLRVKPTVVSLRDTFDRVRRAELEKLRGQMSPEDFGRFDVTSRAMMNKILHKPTEEIKRSVERGEEMYLVYALRQLFDLDETP